MTVTTELPNLLLMGGTGVGKSTAGKLLTELGYERLGCAGIVEAPHRGSPRDVVTRIWGLEALNDREKLITVANACRAIDPDVWLRRVAYEVDLRETRATAGVSRRTPVVIDDVRFDNEYWGLIGRGFVAVRITAPIEKRIDRLKANGKFLSVDYLDSPIEHYLDDTATHYTIDNDGSTDDLYDALVDVLMRERKRT